MIKGWKRSGTVGGSHFWDGRWPVSAELDPIKPDACGQPESDFVHAVGQGKDAGCLVTGLRLGPRDEKNPASWPLPVDLNSSVERIVLAFGLAHQRGAVFVGGRVGDQSVTTSKGQADLEANVGVGAV